MSRSKIQFLIIVLSLLLSTNLYAQTDVQRTVGLTTTIQQNNFGIQIPIWLSNTATLAPSIQFESVQNTGTDFIIGLIPKFYLNTNKLAPYLGFKVGVAIFNPSLSSAKSTSDVIGGIAFGGEYFFDPRFSIGVESQLNYTKSDTNSDRFGNPGGTNINTAMVVVASVYFGKQASGSK